MFNDINLEAELRILVRKFMDSNAVTFYFHLEVFQNKNLIQRCEIKGLNINL